MVLQCLKEGDYLLLEAAGCSIRTGKSAAPRGGRNAASEKFCKCCVGVGNLLDITMSNIVSAFWELQ